MSFFLNHLTCIYNELIHKSIAVRAKCKKISEAILYTSTKSNKIPTKAFIIFGVLRVSYRCVREFQAIYPAKPDNRLYYYSANTQQIERNTSNDNANMIEYKSSQSSERDGQMKSNRFLVLPVLCQFLCV